MNNTILPFAKIETVQDTPLTGNRPWRVVDGFKTAAVLDADGNTLFFTESRAVAHQATIATNAYAGHVAKIATMETALKRIRERLQRATKDQVVSDVQALVDFGLVEDGDEAEGSWREDA